MTDISFIANQIADGPTRESVKKIYEDVTANIFSSFSARVAEVDCSSVDIYGSGVDNIKFAHGLGFVPTDAIITKVTNSETVTLNYDLFDATYIDFNVSGDCKFRIIIGTFGDLS